MSMRNAMTGDGPQEKEPCFYFLMGRAHDTDVILGLTSRTNGERAVPLFTTPDGAAACLKLWRAGDTFVRAASVPTAIRKLERLLADGVRFVSLDPEPAEMAENIGAEPLRDLLARARAVLAEAAAGRLK
jgi:hypothetical protein